ncbi:hypothetical protein SEA_LUCKYBARNES_4 [Brevibacterium phage LuckyBarnes]|uniref:Uncharacterized protein n=1 Tax=Brevibacterium phage LuckyBarnes TaxID=2027888 RepID=A0A249XNM4_9CAUD|nr:hypothetical protein HOS02_gp04 [Brevibacterium phage LuckyBarnes]ASZ73325.1 hypothetical protein SEA_LUCKYBARNES_4 [Brevibacterium phage LuckyBarnes]
MNLADRALKAEVHRMNIMSRSHALAQIHQASGTLPAGKTVGQYAEEINEAHLKDVDTAAYSGGMSWLEAAELTIQAMDEIIINGGTDNE